jgi:hypothetical protein
MPEVGIETEIEFTGKSYAEHGVKTGIRKGAVVKIGEW